MKNKIKNYEVKKKQINNQIKIKNLSLFMSRSSERKTDNEKNLSLIAK